MKIRKTYSWNDAQTDLARGVNPNTVAVRLGTYEEALINHADEMGWPITYNRNRTADAVERLDP